MSALRQSISEKAVFYFLIVSIAILTVAIIDGYTPDMFNQVEYELAKTFGNLDNVLAVR